MRRIASLSVLFAALIDSRSSVQGSTCGSRPRALDGLRRGGKSEALEVQSLVGAAAKGQLINYSQAAGTFT
jgi:hypothetical protein